jgi:hypothetical protein
MRGRRAVARAAGFVLLLFCIRPLAAEDYVRITGAEVNIRTAPSLAAVVVAVAEEGDVFEVRGKMLDWFEIVLFSGEERYISRSLATPVDYTPILPSLTAEAQRVFRVLKGAERRANAQARLKYPIVNRYGRPIPANVPKKIGHERLLNDRYKLQVMRESGLQPPVYGLLIDEATKEDWRER